MPKLFCLVMICLVFALSGCDVDKPVATNKPSLCNVTDRLTGKVYEGVVDVNYSYSANMCRFEYEGKEYTIHSNYLVEYVP